MANCQDADGEDVLLIRRAAVNKESRTADKGWSSSLGVGRGLLLLLTVRISAYYETLHGASDLDRIF
jgi:hypothetical protein